MDSLKWIDEHTSPYDNDFKIGLMLILTLFILLFKGDIFR